MVWTDRSLKTFLTPGFFAFNIHYTKDFSRHNTEHLVELDQKWKVTCTPHIAILSWAYLNAYAIDFHMECSLISEEKKQKLKLYLKP